MESIQFISRNNTESFHLLNSAFRLRSETFKNRLRWEVNSKNGLEQDQFDDMNVSHITMTNGDNEVVGYWRALPTTGSYMLSDVFPQLLRGEAVPRGDKIWEISRFNIKKGHSNSSMKVVSGTCSRLVQSFYDFAQQNDIDSYVLVTTVACERILNLLGIKTRRMGDGEATQVGIERSVALWMDVKDIPHTKHH